MLLFTGLWWALLGAAAAVEHLHAPNDDALPVYVTNTATRFTGTTVFEAEEAPVVISHFRGDGAVEYTPAADRALALIPSTFLDDRNTAVVFVDAFVVEQAESHLGSPHFYLSKDSADAVTADARPARASDIELISTLKHPVLRVGAQDVGALESLLNQIDALETTKVMLVGLPARDSTKRQPQAGLSLAALSRNVSYIDIPAFFDSEADCDSLTNSCSGKGACAKASNGRYACQCTPTEANGYTYYWGGNDCSKRDVSFQASLLVGTTLAIVVASALAIGLLFRLGSEPLPGILNVTATPN